MGCTTMHAGLDTGLMSQALGTESFRTRGTGFLSARGWFEGEPGDRGPTRRLLTLVQTRVK